MNYKQQCKVLSDANSKLYEGIGEAMHRLESMRIWGGMGWHWTHPYAGVAWDMLKKLMDERGK